MLGLSTIVALYFFAVSACPTVMTRAKMTAGTVVRLAAIVAHDIVTMGARPVMVACAIMTR